MPPNHPLAGEVQRVSNSVEKLATETGEIKLELALLKRDVDDNRERAEERHTELLTKISEFSDHGRSPRKRSDASSEGGLKPRRWGVEPGTGREIGTAALLMAGAVSTIIAAYLGGQSGSTASTAEVAEQVQVAVETIEERLPPPPAPAPVAPEPVDAWIPPEADTDTDTDGPEMPDVGEPPPKLLPMRR
jgi:hypothetical protein